MTAGAAAARAPALDRVAGLFASALAIPEGSGARALRMLTLIFSMSGALVLMKAAQSGIFLAAYPRSAIPWAFAASAVMLALTSCLLLVWTPRMTTDRLARLTVSGSAAALLALYALLWTDVAAVRFVLYVVIEAASGVLVIQVWSVASAATDARSARKLMPIAGIGAGLAWSVFGFLVTPLSHWLGSEALLLLAPLLLWLCLALIRAMRQHDLSEARPRARHQGSLLDSFRDGFHFVGSQPLMRLLTALALLSLIIEQFMDFHLMSLARVTYRDADAISSFFGNYFAITSLISLVLLAGPAGRMLASLGATRSLLLFPCLIVGLALMAIVVPGLTTAVLLRGCARVLKQSIWSNSTEQLHTPLSGVRRGQARSAIRGVLAPGGYALTALMLTALPDTADPRIAATLALVTAGLMAWLIAVYARRTYTHALHQAVDERRWEIGSPRGRKTDTLDAETYSAFRVELLGDDPERASLAAEILAATDGQKSAEVLSAGLRHSSPDVRLTVARGLSRNTQFVGEALAEHACHEPEPVVRLACVRALRACANPERSALTTLEQLSSDPDPEVAAAAQVGVLVWTLEGEELGNALLPFLSPSESPARLREALFVLDADSIEARGMQSTLSFILERGDPEARITAAFAVIRAGALSLLPDVVRLLKDPRTAPPVARALVDLTLADGTPASASGPDTLAASLSRIASRMARESVAPPAEALVLRLLQHSDVDIRRSATQALGQSVRDGRHPPLDVSGVLPLVQRDATPAFQRFSILAGLARDDGKVDWEVDEAFMPLVHELELGIERARQDVLALLLLRGKRRLVSAVQVARRRPSAARDAQVAELLDMDLDPLLAPWVVPLFERLSLRERVAAARQLEVLDQAALDDPLYAIVALGDDLLSGVARLCYGERFLTRFGDAVDDSMVPLFEKMRFLRSVPLFQELAGEDLRRLAEMVDTLEFPPGHVVFENGDPGDALYVVLEGCVAMLQGELELARMGEREFFGELALLDSQPRSADARCLATTRVIRLRGADLDELMTHRPAATREIVRVLVKRLRETGRRVQG
ncbi:MAG: cyclic nucleotide-binding domain-containing protein [Sandaracinaceae bacterium]|nr:cyclic nucleotide-binding domain-containing protein [Sandaracinaceae bacterium]